MSYCCNNWTYIFLSHFETTGWGLFHGLRCKGIVFPSSVKTKLTIQFKAQKSLSMSPILLQLPIHSDHLCSWCALLADIPPHWIAYWVWLICSLSSLFFCVRIPWTGDLFWLLVCNTSPSHQIGSVFLLFPNACVHARKEKWSANGKNYPACFIHLQSFPKEIVVGEILNPFV